MTGVLGMADLLSYTRLDQQQQRYVQLIRSSGDTMLAVVNDVLDISRIQAGKLHLDCSNFSPGALVAEMVQLFSTEAEAKGLRVQCRIEGDAPTVVQGDPARFRQIVINLVANALKFTERGQVTVALRLLPDPDFALQLTVRDTGIGIPEDALSRILEPFEQADNSTTRRYGGSGLGLSIVQRIVDAMGGRLGIESNVGAGTTVFVRFPLTAPMGGEAPMIGQAECLTGAT